MPVFLYAKEYLEVVAEVIL
jgi:hypothetical protein